MAGAGLLLVGFVQALLLLLLAPLLTGVARVLRAKMHSRKGPTVWQNYRDLIKLFKRPEVAPAPSSWVFRAAPFVVLTTLLLVAMLIPVITLQSPWSVAGDLILVVYLLALVRFFIALAGLDSGNTFAGFGANREMTMSVLIEPVMVLVLFVMALMAGSTNLGTMSVKVASGEISFHAAVWLGMLAFAFATFVEMNKLPYDLAEAEQELQEGVLAEYSGASLALLKWGLALRQLLMAALFVAIFFPFGAAGSLEPLALVLGAVAFVIKIGIIYVLSAVAENGMVRVRFIKASELVWVAMGTALVSFVFYLANV